MSHHPNTVVAIGCSTMPRYAFLLPLSAMLWRRIGHHLCLLLVGDETEWREIPLLSIVRRALDDPALATYRFLGRLSGYGEATLAQNVRQHAAALTSISPETWVMPSDADLWPLRPDFYTAHEDEKVRACLYYANGDHFQGKADVLRRSGQNLRSQTIPTCHVAMRAADWRTIYDLKDGDLAACTQRTLDGWFATRDKADGMNVWMSDQQIMTEALCQQTWFPDGPLPDVTSTQPVLFDRERNGVTVRHILRRGHPPIDRLDRSHPGDWDKDPRQWIDAHMPEASWTDEMWPKVKRVFAAMLPEHAEWAETYRTAFVAALR